MKKTLGIVGFGQFGEFLYNRLVENLSSKFDFKIYSIDKEPDFELFFPHREVASCDVVILSLPIGAFAGEVDYLANNLKDGALVIDVCSVKVHPKKMMQEKLSNLLDKKVNLVASHPMFGPNSYKKNNYKLDGLNLVLENIGCEDSVYKELLNGLQKTRLNVVEMDADTHDKESAQFHFLTLFTAGVLKDMSFDRSEIETYSFKMLMNFLEGVGADNQIAKDMYKYNPYCKGYLEDLKKSFDSFYSEIKNS